MNATLLTRVRKIEDAISLANPVRPFVVQTLADNDADHARQEAEQKAAGRYVEGSPLLVIQRHIVDPPIRQARLLS